MKKGLRTPLILSLLGLFALSGCVPRVTTGVDEGTQVVKTKTPAPKEEAKALVEKFLEPFRKADIGSLDDHDCYTVSFSVLDQRKAQQVLSDPKRKKALTDISVVEIYGVKQTGADQYEVAGKLHWGILSKEPEFDFTLWVREDGTVCAADNATPYFDDQMPLNQVNFAWIYRYYVTTPNP